MMNEEKNQGVQHVIYKYCDYINTHLDNNMHTEECKILKKKMDELKWGLYEKWENGQDSSKFSNSSINFNGKNMKANQNKKRRMRKKKSQLLDEYRSNQVKLTKKGLQMKVVKVPVAKSFKSYKKMPEISQRSDKKTKKSVTPDPDESMKIDHFNIYEDAKDELEIEKQMEESSFQEDQIVFEKESTQYSKYL